MSQNSALGLAGFWKRLAPTPTARASGHLDTAIQATHTRGTCKVTESESSLPHHLALGQHGFSC